MSDLLPLFPLGLVVFPGEKLNLHIFEERYRELIRDCDEKGISFGIPPFIENTMMDVGTEMRLLSIEKVYLDGKMDVKTEGVGLFEIEKFHRNIDGKLYSGAEVTKRNFSDDGGDILNKKKIYDQILELFEFMKIDKSIPENYEHLLTFKIAQHVGLNINQKYAMLQLPAELERQEFVIDHLDRLIPMVKEMETMRRRIQMNGHFKNIDPPKF